MNKDKDHRTHSEIEKDRLEAERKFGREGDRERDDANRDPISGTPGAHPVGAGLGAAGGGAAGAAIGSIAGPVGTVAGAVIGGVAGGLAGKAAAEAVNPTIEDEYWRGNYRTRPYVASAASDTDYDRDYQPAYRYGWECYARYPGRRFEDVEPELARDWERHRGKSTLSWDRARDATRDAWHRLERAIPGDADNDGR